jgi:hypothetical protein
MARSGKGLDRVFNNVCELDWVNMELFCIYIAVILISSPKLCPIVQSCVLKSSILSRSWSIPFKCLARV